MNLIAEILLPAGVTKVTIRDIPELFATALYPGMNENTSEEMTDSKLIAWQATVDEYKKEVKSAISRGLLIPHSPITFLPIPDALGQQLLSSFVTIENLKEYAGNLQIDLKISPISQTDTTTANTGAVRGEPKKVIQRVFADLHFSYKQWGRNLGDAPKWLIDCRVSRGSKGKSVSHTWNPVSIGVALMDKGITKKQLNLAFMNLKDWLKEWQEATDLMD